MTKGKQPTMADIAQMTGLPRGKVSMVLGQGDNRMNLHRVTDDEMAEILHAAAELGYNGPPKPEKKKAVTAEMVAKRAGVSLSTVYYTLSGRYAQISEETRAHVRRIAGELGYKPSRESKLKDFYAKRT